MNPVYKEKYVLSEETFGYFTIDQNKPKLDKNKRSIKIAALVKIIGGILLIISSLVTKQSSLLFLGGFSVFMIGFGIYDIWVKLPKYDKQIWENVKNSYKGRQYGENWFEVKFYDDHLRYLVGGNTDDLYYSDFNQFFETEHYFCIHFLTGDLIIFNPDCNREKIKDIIISCRKKGECHPELDGQEG